MHAAILAIQKEDPTIVLHYMHGMSQQLVAGQGELHLNLPKWRLAQHYKIEVEHGSPRVSYRETIRKAAKANCRHKKQTGGSGQFGEVRLKIEPWTVDMPGPTGHTCEAKKNTTCSPAESWCSIIAWWAA